MNCLRDKKSLRFLSCTMARLKALSGNCLLFNKKQPKLLQLLLKYYIICSLIKQKLNLGDNYELDIILGAFGNRHCYDRYILFLRVKRAEFPHCMPRRRRVSVLFQPLLPQQAQTATIFNSAFGWRLDSYSEWSAIFGLT